MVTDVVVVGSGSAGLAAAIAAAEKGVRATFFEKQPLISRASSFFSGMFAFERAGNLHSTEWILVTNALTRNAILIVRNNEIASNWVDRMEKEGNAVLIPGLGDTVVVVDHFGSQPSDYSRIQFADGRQGWIPDFELKDKTNKKLVKHKKFAKNTTEDPMTRHNQRMASDGGH